MPKGTVDRFMQKEKRMLRKVVILGSGPAGLTAAIYAARAELKPIVIDGVQAGGQLMITTEVDNFPGFPEGIQGPELMDRMRKQAERFGVEIIGGTADAIDISRRPFKITVGEEVIETETLIVSTGATARWLGLEAEVKLRGKGISACATCDGFFFKNKDVMVVGGGDTAVEEALFLTHFAKTVTIIHRRDQLRASKALQSQAAANPKIKFMWNTIVEDIMDVTARKVTGVKVKDVKSGESRVVPCDGVFMAIGHVPNTAVLKGQLTLDETGYIITKPGTSLTNVEGVFAAGDVADRTYRQAITAAGTGCMAAIDAERFLGENR